MLSVKDLVVHYGAIRAIRGISFEVNRGEIITLIGSNGAGKTSTLHAVSNILKKTSGSVYFNDTDITIAPPSDIVRSGLVQSPEGRRVFADLSVRDNLEMGAYTRKDRPGIARDMDKVFSLFPRLKERYKQDAGTLSGGEQQMLAIGRALMANPVLLLLDEPSMGLAPILVDEIFSIIETINREGTTILLVEQNAFKALRIANRAYILETGEIVKTGTGADLLADDSVKKAYLGG
ncbi:MAG TPA: ABC transporter ATP-binding protein [Treponemataceae bacterium]|jgi:branched-chain amino acid transport system ATP-binding protein|nr:ABC transporter ATP-binding protein [Treponema sp.]OQB04804.1 MAG: High-affinity branched-chain amino acid transport ATP-binding protein LivF [Spirochaetes bacterium ADurb.Bin215]HOF85454.1 ABC transporter ATP-binding protein [Treponemataceae bacterium]HOS35015.1 ABC transporter ATP-binding protein [Treponemataceae bacterium]HOU37684.1 ABC transporter ATP-binding protein [Treponemataceae bacterium]